MEDELPNLQFQIVALQPTVIPSGYVAIVILHCPIAEVQVTDSERQLAPCFKLNARQAMEIGMNLIHIAKIAENNALAEEK